MLPEVIRTRRLTLRPPREEDAGAIFQGYAQDPAVTRFLQWRPHQSIAETERFLQECVRAWAEGERRPWTITREPVDSPRGMVELRVMDHRAELGYVLARAEWGQGLMTEAVEAVLAAALAEPALYRVAAVCDVENVASARVMEKSGMVREGRLRRFAVHPNVAGEPRDVFLYARTR